ncbi:uncharacterized protein LOC107040189 [Diachasma alloeum]|uniref:uncharacterized protein LOC107040189 n=1 Tax=Diachasma alloeum TaxID=454923 RepID=UPI000738101D|nr:uncharacterized protein LOC107040189 [Diachasma alloeum]
MRSCGLMAAFAAILISHAGATDNKSPRSTVSFIDKFINGILSNRTACKANYLDAVHIDYVIKMSQALAFSSVNFKNPVFKDALEAARKEGKNVEKCANASKSIEEIENTYLLQLDFCRIEHRPDYKSVDTSIDKWQKEGRDLQEEIKLNSECFREHCGEQCKTPQCDSLKRIFRSWKKKGLMLRREVRRFNKMKTRTLQCFAKARLHFRKAHKKRNNRAFKCIANSV